MTKKIFEITRKGIFNFNSGKQNQCFKKNHLDFQYEIKLRFHTQYEFIPKGTLFDHRDQLFDHEKLHKFLVDNMGKVANSCENMHVTLHELVMSFLSTKNCKDYLYEYEATILPYDVHSRKVHANINGFLKYFAN